MKKIYTEEQAAVQGGRQMRAKMGTYTVIVSLIVLAVLVVVNLLVSLIPTRFTIIDLSVNQIYSISEASEKAAHKLREDVTIYYLKDSSQSEDLQMETFLERYATLNSHITLKAVDPVTAPNFTKQYANEELSNYSIIIESAKRYRVIDYFDMFYYEGGIAVDDSETLTAYQYYYGSLPPLYFNGETLITSALDYVTTDDIPTAYVLSGHGEGALSASFRNRIATNNINLVDSLLLAQGIPEDCDILIINAPASTMPNGASTAEYDLTEQEAATIIAYLQNGGNVLLTTMPGVADMPNLLSVAQACGLDAIDGIVVEGDTDHHYPNYAYYLLPEVQAHATTSPLMASYMITLPLSHAITRTETLPAGVTIAPLFSTTSSAYTIDVMASDTSKTADSKTGTFWVGVASELESGGKLIWLPSSVVLTDTANSLTGANYAYAVEMLNWMSPRDTILSSISAISMSEQMLTVTAGGALFWSAVFVLIIPTAFMVTGLVIWIRRRRK